MCVRHSAISCCGHAQKPDATRSPRAQNGRHPAVLYLKCSMLRPAWTNNQTRPGTANTRQSQELYQSGVVSIVSFNMVNEKHAKAITAVQTEELIGVIRSISDGRPTEIENKIHQRARVV